MTQNYIKYNSYRKKEFATKTTIGCREGKPFIKKEALFHEAEAFIDRFINQCELLRRHYHEIQICDAYPQNGSVEFSYIKGPTFQDMLMEIVSQRKRKKFVDLLYSYKDILLDNGRIKTKKITHIDERMKEVFGSFDIAQYGFDSIELSNIDLSFENLYFCDNKWVMVDYEWVFSFPLPIKYIIYRNVGIYYAKHEVELKNANFMSLQEVFKLFDISKNDTKIFAAMECHFQKYVHGSSVEIYDGYLKNNQTLARLEQAASWAREMTDCSKLYWQEKGEYSEKNSVSIKADPDRVLRPKGISEKISFIVDCKIVELEEFRVDISQYPCAFKLINICITNEYGEEICRLEPKLLNANLIHSEYYIFLHDDTQIIFDPVSLCHKNFDDKIELIIEILFIKEEEIVAHCLEYRQQMIEQNLIKIERMSEELSVLGTDKQELISKIKDYSLQIDEFKINVANDRKKIANYEEKILKYQTEMNDLKEKLESALTSNSTNEGIINDLKIEMDDLKEKLESALTSNSTNEGIIYDLNNKMAECVQNNEEQKRSAEEHLRKYEKQISEYDEEIRSQKEKISELSVYHRSEICELRSELDSIYNSRSWRLVSFIRKLLNRR
jgi:predicted  nucleic acid-binding Zn-ribbon protein